MGWWSPYTRRETGWTAVTSGVFSSYPFWENVSQLPWTKLRQDYWIYLEDTQCGFCHDRRTTNEDICHIRQSLAACQRPLMIILQTCKNVTPGPSFGSCANVRRRRPRHPILFIRLLIPAQKFSSVQKAESQNHWSLLMSCVNRVT